MQFKSFYKGLNTHSSPSKRDGRIYKRCLYCIDEDLLNHGPFYDFKKGCDEYFATIYKVDQNGTCVILKCST